MSLLQPRAAAGRTSTAARRRRTAHLPPCRANGDLDLVRVVAARNLSGGQRSLTDTRPGHLRLRRRRVLASSASAEPGC